MKIKKYKVAVCQNKPVHDFEVTFEEIKKTFLEAAKEKLVYVYSQKCLFVLMS